MSVSTFDQFTALQNALSELNYSQPLLRESVPLVQAIFTDLIDVTRKYTQIRKQSEQTQKELRSQIDPIKIENDKLTKSNNELHLKIIQNTDKHQADLRAMERECERLKLAHNEINVLLNQKKHKIKNQESTINNLKKKMNAVISSHGGNHKKLIGKSSKISFSSNLLSPASSKRGGGGDAVSDDFEHKDTMEDDHEKLVLLEQENATLLDQIKEMTSTADRDKQRVVELEQKLKVREQEIHRIHDTLNIDDNRIKYIQYQQEKDSESMKIRHLESQIEVLQNEMSSKESECKEMKVKDSVIERLKEENQGLSDKLEVTWKEMDKLKVDLAAIRSTSKALKLEKKYDILKSTKKLSKNVNELTLMQNKIEELTKLNKVLETKLNNKSKAHSILQEKQKDGKSTNRTMTVALELKEKEVDKLRMEQIDLMKVADELKTRIKDLRHEMEINRNERENLEMTLKSTENKLSIVSKDNEEWHEKYESLKALTAKSQGSNKEMTDDINNLLFKIKTLEKEKEAMNQRLVHIMEQKHDFEKSGSKKQSENFELAKQLQHVQFKNEDLKKDKEWSEKEMMGKVAKITKLEQEKKELNLTIDRVQSELDALKRKYQEMEYKYNSQIKRGEALEDKLSQSESMVASLKLVKSEFDLEAKSKNHLELELIRLTAENDKLLKESKVLENGDKRKAGIIAKIDAEKNDLKLILQQMQQRMIQFQQRLSAITAERDHLKTKYDDVINDVDSKNAQIETGTLCYNDIKVECTKLQNEVKALTQQRDELQSLYDGKERMARESMSQIEQFQKIQDGLNQNIRQQLEEKQALQHSLREVTKLKDDVQSKFDSLRSEYNNLKENVVPSLNQQVIVAQVETGELKVLCNKLDDGQKSAHQKIEDLHRRNQALNKAVQDEVAKFEEMQQRVNEQEANNQRLRAALQKLVDKHDALQNELDNGSELTATLRSDVAEGKKRNEEFESILSETQQQYRCQQKSMVEMVQKLKYAEQLISKLQGEVIPQLEEESRLKAEQLKHSTNDLEAITKENQFLNNEYAVTLNDRDSKNKQLSTALNKVMCLESQCKSIQNERTQILENYKAVCLENERLNQLSELLDRNKSEGAVKIAALEEHIVRRDYRIKDLEKHLTECNLSNHELQRQNQSLTRDLQRSNLNNSKNQTMSSNLQKDLEAMQQNVVQKQQSNLEKKTQIILEFKKENKNLQQIIKELQLEKQVALQQLTSAETKMEKLENVIRKLRVDQISNHEVNRKDNDESNKLKRELNDMKNLNERLNEQLGKLAS